MEGVIPVGASNSKLRELVEQGKVVGSDVKYNELKSKDSSAKKQDSRIALVDPLKNLEQAQVSNDVELFNSGSLPLHGLYDVQLKDKNQDGRVDAGDAISEYMLIADRARADQKNKKPVDQVA